MTSHQAWADAYLAQARADLVGAHCVQGRAPSVYAMLLQMVFEKLAKAALLRTGAVHLVAVQRSHRAASRMISVLRLQRGILEPLGGSPAWQDVFWVVEALESAHPQLAEPSSPILEYPWQDQVGTVKWPERDLAIAARLGDPSNNLGPRVLRFAALLSDRFDAVFP